MPEERTKCQANCAKMSSVRLGDTDIMVVGEQKAPNEDDDDGDGELTRASASLKPSPGKSLLRKLSSKGVGRDRAQSDATLRKLEVNVLAPASR